MAFVPDPSHPHHFFKYCKPCVAKLVLSNAKIRWSSPLLFNDPFDCYFSPSPRFDTGDMIRKLHSRFRTLLTQKEEPLWHSSNPHHLLLRELRSVVHQAGCPASLIDEIDSQNAFDEARANLDRLNAEAHRDWQARAREHRIFCVCENNDNLLLWSHYAASHTGVAFQFECLRDRDVPLLAAERVIYSDDAPGLFDEPEWLDSCLGIGPEIDGSGVWRRLVMTKASDWQYEKEWRVVTLRRSDEVGDFLDVGFYPKELSKVFLGCRITESDKTSILGLLIGRFSHVEVYQAQQHPLKFGLLFERIR